MSQSRINKLEKELEYMREHVLNLHKTLNTLLETRMTGGANVTTMSPYQTMIDTPPFVVSTQQTDSLQPPKIVVGGDTEQPNVDYVQRVRRTAY
jgi:hypothetical protein